MPGKNSIKKETLIRLKKGDIHAFEEIYREFSGRLFNFIATALYDKSLAEDLTQTCFLKIWERRAELDPDKGFTSYIHTIAKHLVYKETEKRILESHFFDTIKDKIDIEDRSTEQTIDERFLKEQVMKLVQKLPDARRNIFIMSRIKGMSNKEIAGQLGISEKTVETQIQRATYFLRDNFRNYLIILALLILS